MKTNLKLPILLIALLFTFVLVSYKTADKANTNPESNTVVTLQFKAQPEKGSEAAENLVTLIENVREEPHFVKIKMHIDPNDDTHIMLYEEWEDIDYYNSDHMQTPHIKKFMEDSKNFLEGPPEITQWKVKRVFK